MSKDNISQEPRIPLEKRRVTATINTITDTVIYAKLVTPIYNRHYTKIEICHLKTNNTSHYSVGNVLDLFERIRSFFNYTTK